MTHERPTPFAAESDCAATSAAGADQCAAVRRANRRADPAGRFPLPCVDRERGRRLQRLVANRSARRSRLEAVLFLAREPLSLRKLAQLANLTDATEARTLLTDLRGMLRRAGVCVSGGTAGWGVSIADAGRNLHRGCGRWCRASEQIRLSPPALETLAVVAYRQPVLRAEVEAIRGVACGEILRQLMDRDLLRIVGRSEELGRPLWYGTTKRFLEVFGLCNLDELPLAAQLRREPRARAERAIDGGAIGGGRIRRRGVAERCGRRLDLVIVYV